MAQAAHQAAAKRKQSRLVQAGELGNFGADEQARKGSVMMRMS